MTSYLRTLAADRIVTLGGDPIVIDGGLTPLATVDFPVGASYAIDLCVGWAKVAECVTGTLDAIVRHLALGEWSLTGYVDDIDFEGAFTLADVDTVRVVQGSTIVFGGYVAPVTSGVGGLDVVETAQGTTFTLKGADLWSLLAGRVAYPTPATNPPWAGGHDDRVGVASTVAAGYIRDNLGSGALAARQVPGLALVDGAAGLSGTWSARLQPLDKLIARVCADGGITCRATVDFVGNVTYTLGPARDRSDTVVLSDQGGLTGVHRVTATAVATFVVAGGQGELAARTFATAGTATGALRREVFSDQTSLATSTEVQQAANATLAADAETLTVAAQVADVAALGLTYLANYDVGDIIAAEIDGVRYPVSVDAVTLHIGVDRAVVRPVLGRGALNLVAGLLRDVADLQTRFDTQIA